MYIRKRYFAERYLGFLARSREVSFKLRCITLASIRDVFVTHLLRVSIFMCEDCAERSREREREREREERHEPWEMRVSVIAAIVEEGFPRVRGRYLERASTINSAFHSVDAARFICTQKFPGVCDISDLHVQTRRFN